MRNAWKWLIAASVLLGAAGLAGCATPEESDDNVDTDIGPGQDAGVQEPGEPDPDLDPGQGRDPGVAEPGEDTPDLDIGPGDTPGDAEPGEVDLGPEG